MSALRFVAWQVYRKSQKGKKKQQKTKPKQQIWGFLLNEANRKIHQNLPLHSGLSQASAVSSGLQTPGPFQLKAYGWKLCWLCGIAFISRGEELLLAVGFTVICYTAQRANVATTGFSSAGKSQQWLETPPHSPRVSLIPAPRPPTPSLLLQDIPELFHRTSRERKNTFSLD